MKVKRFSLLETSMKRPSILNSARPPIASIPRTRHLIFLGDLIDRGTESIAAVNLVMTVKTHARAGNLHNVFLCLPVQPQPSCEGHCWQPPC